MLPKKKNIYSVSQINSYIRGMFSQDFLLNGLRLRGEVSNLTDHASGHLYFTLKDEKSSISCVMFAKNRKGLPFALREGMQVIVSGEIDVFERDGKYQLYAKSIEADGEGGLAARYEKLKKELEERGMFDPAYKRAIPFYVRRLGVVTAPTGAAVRDIIQISKRRNPFIQIILYPAIVQGEKAVPSIVRGIHALEELGVDAIIAGRGGGSLEDLWAFNEEAVAQAFFDCVVPIISAVGHETDVALSDFVADLRAPTPSAAAELAVCDIRLVLERLTDLQDSYYREMSRKLLRRREWAKGLEARLQARNPARQLREKRGIVLSFEDRLMRAMTDRLAEERRRLSGLEAPLRGGMERKLAKEKYRLGLLAERLHGKSPLEKLRSGFSYVRTGDGKALKNVRQARIGEPLDIFLQDGKVAAKVLNAEGFGEGNGLSEAAWQRKKRN
ncbi:MAG: exodeoxyribonuclease VII large subunit [Lachnospiraceae bacterium]|nr:exodeoxyribonuclease VII large subunit [Lachnospiraceae bacterium]